MSERATLMNGCMPRTPFLELVSAASTAGFEAITLWPNVWRHAQRKEGLSLAAMRSILDDHGLVLSDVDACSDWVPAPAQPVGPLRASTPRSEFFEVCHALGGTTVVAGHLTDAGLDMERDTAAFEQLCRDADEYGLRIGLEFIGFSDVHDVATAWAIVEGCGRPNAGLVVDLGHHIRGSHDDDALRRLPADRIFTVQLVDGPLEPPADLLDEAMFHRLMPGRGEFPVTEFVSLLDSIGVSATIGVEVFDASDASHSAADVAAAAFAASSDALLLARAGRAHDGDRGTV